MLLVVGADTAVVWTPIYRLGMRFFGIFAGFVVVSYLLVIFDIDGDKHFLKTMLLTGFGKIYIAILKNDLGAYLPMAFNTKADSMIIINIIPFISHILLRLKN